MCKSAHCIYERGQHSKTHSQGEVIEMKKINSIITNLILISIFAAIGCVATMAQRSDTTSLNRQDVRPFDFTDEYYSQNGVQPHFITNRPTGADERSVYSKTSDQRFSSVRILETLPAYNFDGSIIYFNMYGQLFEQGFNEDKSGVKAMEIAKKYPMFVFPSSTVRGSNRQANLIEAHKDYFVANPLGLSLVVEVVYTFRGQSAEGNRYLNTLGETNGYSLDGTPIIKTIDEINYLTRMGLVTQQVQGLNNRGEAPFAIAKVLQTSKAGAVTRDAFLTTVTDENGQPLKAETSFIENFTCLRRSGSPCLNGTQDRR